MIFFSGVGGFRACGRLFHGRHEAAVVHTRFSFFIFFVVVVFVSEVFIDPFVAAEEWLGGFRWERHEVAYFFDAGVHEWDDLFFAHHFDVVSDCEKRVRVSVEMRRKEGLDEMFIVNGLIICMNS